MTEEPLAAAARIVTPVRLSQAARAQLDVIAGIRGVTRSGLIRTYLKAGLERDLRLLHHRREIQDLQQEHTQSPR